MCFLRYVDFLEFHKSVSEEINNYQTIPNHKMKSVAALVVVNTLLVSAPVVSPDCGVQGLTLSKKVFFGSFFGRSKNNVGSDKYQSLVDNQDQNKDLEFYQGQENIQNNRNVDSPVADGTPSEQGAEKEQALENDKPSTFIPPVALLDILIRGIEVQAKSGSKKRPTIKLVLGSPSHAHKFVLFEDFPKKSYCKKERAVKYCYCNIESVSMKVSDVNYVSCVGQDANGARIMLSGKNGQELEFVLPLDSKMAQQVVAALKAIVHNIDDVMSAKH